MITLSVIIAILDYFSIMRIRRKIKDSNIEPDVLCCGLYNAIISVCGSFYLAVMACYLIITYLP